MDDKEKQADESDDRFRERLTWNSGDIDILEVPDKTPEELEAIKKQMKEKKSETDESGSI